MRHIALILSLLLGLVPGSAQIKGNIPQLLERAEGALYQSGATVVDFSTTMRDKAGRDLGASTGKMYLQGEAFRLEYGTVTAVYSSGILTYYDRAEHTLTISRPTADEILQINPLHFLRSRARGFTAMLLSSTTTQQRVRFVPQQKSNIVMMEATFNLKSSLPSQLTFLARDGSVLTALVPEIKSREALPKTFFYLNAKSYPGCEVVDLR